MRRRSVTVHRETASAPPAGADIAGRRNRCQGRRSTAAMGGCDAVIHAALGHINALAVALAAAALAFVMIRFALTEKQAFRSLVKGRIGTQT